MKTIIVDDDQTSLDLIRNFCKKYAPSLKLVGTADNVDAGVKLIDQKYPDLLFLDVELYDRKGFEILEQIEQPDLMVVMITAHPQYTFDAIPYRVMDYLLKPIDIQLFIAAVDRCRNEYPRIQKIRELLKQASLQGPVEARFLTVINKDQYQIIRIEEVLRLEADGNYCLVVTTKGAQHISTKSLQYYESRLPANRFVRVHHSHIINIDEVKQLLRHKHLTMKLTNNDEIPVSVRRYKELVDRIFI